MIIRRNNNNNIPSSFNNAYGKSLDLTESERIILQLFYKYGKDKTLYHDGIEKYMEFKCIYCKNKQYGWLINASGLDKENFVKSFYHLLINGVIEKVFWNKKDNNDICFRIPLKISSYKYFDINEPFTKLNYLDKLYLRQKEKSYNEWMNS